MEQNVPEENIAQSFEVTADSYGGCERIGCTSYRISEDGGYTFIGVTRADEDLRFEDSLSEKLTEGLLDMAAETNFRKIEDSIFTGSCPAHVDGIAYRFDIQSDGDRYSIDTCENDISISTSDFFDKLIDYFEIFRITHST